MNSVWVKDLTILFENFTRLQRTQNSTKKLSMDSQLTEENEHCITIEKGRQLFEKQRQHSLRIKKPTFNKFNSYDIFSGKVDDPDIPPIEAEIDEPGVYTNSNKDQDLSSDQASGEPSGSTTMTSSKTTDQQQRAGADANAKRLSYQVANKRYNYRVQSHQFKDLVMSTDRDLEKENRAVMMRMKNQLNCYDEKAKYRSILLESPSPPPPPAAETNEPIIMRTGPSPLPSRHELASVILPSGHPLNSNYRPSMELSNSYNNRLIEATIASTSGEEDDLEPPTQSDMDYLPPASSAVHDPPAQSTNGPSTDIRGGDVSPQRLLWSQTSEGKKLIQMKKLGKDVIKWQETQFELITSEASYYKSLELLVEQIYKSPAMDCCQSPISAPSYIAKAATLVSINSTDSNATSYQPTCLMTPLEKHHLFSNILEIHILSGEMLKALESRWRQNPFLDNLGEVFIEFYALGKLRPYVTYLRNQQYQTETLNKLQMKSEFQQLMKSFETSLTKGGIVGNLSSLLMLPMQRPFRLKLLMQAVQKNTPPQYLPADLSEDKVQKSIDVLEQLIRDCSDGKLLMEQKEQLLRICSRLRFKAAQNSVSMKSGGTLPSLLSPLSVGLRPLLLETNARFLRCSNQVVGSRGSSFYRRQITGRVYLFEDQLVISQLYKPRRRWTSPGHLCAGGKTDPRETPARSPTDHHGDDHPLVLDPPEQVVAQWPRLLVRWRAEACCEGGSVSTPQCLPRAHFKLELFMPSTVASTPAIHQDSTPIRIFRIQVTVPHEIDQWREALFHNDQSSSTLNVSAVQSAVVIKEIRCPTMMSASIPTNEVVQIPPPTYHPAAVPSISPDEILVWFNGKDMIIPRDCISINP